MLSEEKFPGNFAEKIWDRMLQKMGQAYARQGINFI